MANAFSHVFLHAIDDMFLSEAEDDLRDAADIPSLVV